MINVSAHIHIVGCFRDVIMWLELFKNGSWLSNIVALISQSALLVSLVSWYSHQ